MKVWRLSTSQVELTDRPRAWREAMDRLCLPIASTDSVVHDEGRIACNVSPLGMEFSLIEAASAEYAGRYPNQTDAIWLSLAVEGVSFLSYEGQTWRIEPGDIVYGPNNVDAKLVFPGPFRQLFVRAPKLVLDSRVFAPGKLRLGHIRGDTGVCSIFSSMLIGLADALMDVSSHDLRPVELAVTEFLLTSLQTEKAAFALGGAQGARAAHLHRVCQDIETVLSEPDLSLSRVAQISGASTRYVQKLFQNGGKRFSTYIRARRLERCRQDLVSPTHAHLSISEICFRWGFNSTAHFSRSFRDQFGVSPREFRRGAAIADEASQRSAIA